MLGVVVDETLDRPDRDDVITMWARLHPDRFDDPVRAALTTNQKADAANILANELNVAGDEDRADRLSRLALEYKPNDASAANNLGYRLLERDKNVVEAVALIERAYRLEPEAPHIIDSMAWAMYKIGVVHDEFDANGTLVRPGAISLLNRALKIVGQAGGTADTLLNRPVMLDHLGDAQWAAGERESAIASWRESLMFCENALTPANRRRYALFGEGVLQEIEKSAEGLRAKLAAVDAGEAPPIASMVRPVNTGAPGERAPDPAPDPEPVPDDPPMGDEPPGVG